MKKLKLLTILSSFMLLASCGGGTVTDNNGGNNNNPFNPFNPGGTTSINTNPFNPGITSVATSQNYYPGIASVATSQNYYPGIGDQNTPTYNVRNVANSIYENSASDYASAIQFASTTFQYSTRTSTVFTILSGTFIQNGSQVTLTINSGYQEYNGQRQELNVYTVITGEVYGDYFSLTVEGVTEVFTLSNGGSYTPTNPSVAPTSPSTYPGPISNSAIAPVNSLSGRTFSVTLAESYNTSFSFYGKNEVTYSTIAGNEGYSYFYGTYSVSGNTVEMYFTYMDMSYSGETYSGQISQSMTGTLSGNTLTITVEGVALTLYEGGGSYNPTPTSVSNEASVAGRGFSHTEYGETIYIIFFTDNTTQTGGTVDGNTYEYEGTYTQNGSNITMHYNKGYMNNYKTQVNVTYNCTLSGNQLILSNGSQSITFNEYFW